jgi:hypothetical protein
MKMFTKKNHGCRFFLPKADFLVQGGIRGRTVFFESEPVELSAYLICRKRGISRRNDVLKNYSQREFVHRIVSDHVCGGIDPFVI